MRKGIMQDIQMDPSIPKKMFYKIGEISQILGVKPYVLRYWETEFKQIKPSKNRFGQRVYRPKDLMVLLRVKELLYGNKFTIAGAKKQLSNERLASGGQKAEKHNKLEQNDLNQLLLLLQEHKNCLKEILNIFNSEGFETKSNIGA